MPMRGAFILARYSTDQQNPDTIEVQVNKCTEWCEKNGLPVLGVFADFAVSGMKDTRPQYEMMMQQLRQGNADTVVIYDQSRMFRKMTAWFTFRDELQDLGVSVVAVTQPMIGGDLNDPGFFLAEGSMALFNQMWALQTRQKVVEKMRHMANTGQHTGGKPPLGYSVENGRLVICEQEARIVRRIFNEYAAGRSYKTIIDGLNRDGLKTKRGNSFGNNSLHDLLKNEKYTGVLIYGQRPYRSDGTRNTHAKNGKNAIRIEDAVPAIIDRALFDDVQSRMAQNRRQQGGRPPKKREYPLKGKVFCGECKSAMTIGTSQRVYDYYKCSGKKRLHNCSCSPIRVDELEQIVLDAVQHTLGHPNTAQRLIQIMRDEADTILRGAADALRNLTAKQRDVSRQLSNAVDAVLNGLSSPTIKKRITELESEKASLEAQIRQLKRSAEATAIPESAIGELLRQISEANTPEESAAMLSIVARVEVYDDRIVIWTILDKNKDGKYDYEQEGVIITPGIPSGVPRVIVTAGLIKLVVAKSSRSG